MLLACQSQLQEVEAENSRLQLRLKELSEEYRCRLTQYIRDVAVGTPGLKEAASFLLAAAVPLLSGLREVVGAVLEAGRSPHPMLGCLAESLAWPGEEVPAPSWRRFPVRLHRTISKFLLGLSFLVRLLGLKDPLIYYGCLPVGFQSPLP